MGCNAYQWIPFTQDTVNALTVCFDAGWPYAVGTTKGILLNDGPSYSWQSYNYGLPVWDIIADPDTAGVFMLVMGDGSYSDGIYKFYPATHTYRVLDWVVNPTFIRFNEANHSFYAGTRFNGMKTSTDGIHWSDVPYFSGKAAAAIDIFRNHITVIQENNQFGTFYSNDTGRTWQQSSSVIPIHDLAYNRNGKLYGIFTGLSNSSGLYSSFDFGATWNREYWELGMNTIGFDVMGDVFVGWHPPLGAVDGIGVYDSTRQSFTFLNATLPNKNINKLKGNPFMASIAMFACTDSGVFMCNDYSDELGINDNHPQENNKVFPNPSFDKVIIEIADSQKGELLVYNATGKCVMLILVKGGQIILDKAQTGTGLFIYQLKFASGKTFSGKFLFQ